MTNNDNNEEDDGAALVQQILQENPPDERGVRDEWEGHVGWHRKEDILGNESLTALRGRKKEPPKVHNNHTDLRHDRHVPQEKSVPPPAVGAPGTTSSRHQQNRRSIPKWETGEDGQEIGMTTALSSGLFIIMALLILGKLLFRNRFRFRILVASSQKQR
jgi:hypothetical protein